MKLALISICDEDKDRVLKKMIEQGCTPTFIASTGDFLEFGKSLLLLGLEEEKINEVRSILDMYTRKSQIKGGEELKAEMMIVNSSFVKV